MLNNNAKRRNNFLSIKMDIVPLVLQLLSKKLAERSQLEALSGATDLSKQHVYMLQEK